MLGDFLLFAQNFNEFSEADNIWVKKIKGAVGKIIGINKLHHRIGRKWM